jgi:TonB family protein
MKKDARKLFAFACFVALTGGVVCLGKGDPSGAESLLTHARKLQNVWSEGTPAVKVRTEIEIVDAKGKTVPGKYLVTWVSPSRWREELEIGDYKRLRVHDGKGYWQKSNLSFQPQIAFQLNPILDFSAALRVGTKQALGKVKSREKNGNPERCVEVKWTAGTERILCFDDANGSLVSIEYPRRQDPYALDISKVEYSAFDNLGDKRIPHEVHAFRDRAVVVTAKITDLKPITEEDPGLFAAPTNSEFWPQCGDIQTPELVNHVFPKYPTSAKMHGEQGRVVFYAVIETDGTLSHLMPIERLTPTLESAAADAIRQWRYKPAACGSTPIRVETSIPVDFWLQR